MSKILCVISLVKNGLRLNGILRSQTTRDQWKATVPLAVFFTVAGLVVPEWSDPAAAASIASVLVPVMMRALMWRKKTASPIVLPDVNIVRARRATDTTWQSCIGTLYDAREEGYDIATAADGTEWDIAAGEPTGSVYRLPEPAPPGMKHLEELKDDKE